MDNQNNFNIIDLYKLLLSHWKIITLTTVLASCCATIFALLTPNMYTSTALLIPTSNTSSALSSVKNQFGGLASLAGLNLSVGDEDESQIAIEIMKSNTFLMQFIEKEGILPPLFAAKSWDKQSDELILDESIYNPTTEEWRRTGYDSAKPSYLEAAEEISKLITIERNDMTGIIAISISFLSPDIAKIWLEKLILEINTHMKDRAISKSNKSLDYLYKQIDTTTNQDLKNVLYGLIENHMQILTIANITDQYTFEIISHPIKPERHSSPKRKWIIAAIAFLSFTLACITVAFGHIVRTLNVNDHLIE